jgi:hypothetical protein
MTSHQVARPRLHLWLAAAGAATGLLGASCSTSSPDAGNENSDAGRAEPAASSSSGGPDSTSGSGSGSCVPAPGSCDAPAPQMDPMDLAQGCLGAPIALTPVCSTSVNRCAGSAGIGPVCAFSPDGGIYVAIMSDNYMLTAKGWRFSQPLNSFPDPAAIPPEENATTEQEGECTQALCAPPCPGAPRLAYGSWPGCTLDAGEGGASSTDATED